MDLEQAAGLHVDEEVGVDAVPLGVVRVLLLHLGPLAEVGRIDQLVADGGPGVARVVELVAVALAAAGAAVSADSRTSPPW